MPTNPDFPSETDRTSKSSPGDPPSKNKGRPPHQESEGGWKEIAKTIGLSLILALGIRQFVAEARYIPSESMVPTLLVNDRLIVEKISYRFRPPERGDIIVFIPPDSASQYCLGPQAADIKIKDAFIKRVVALPGEKVEVRDGMVLINDQPLQENYIAAKPEYQLLPEVIPPDTFLVLGDNRNNSCDGHFWGPVPRQNIIGRAAFRFWPPNRLGDINAQTELLPQPVSDPNAPTVQPMQPVPESGQPPIESPVTDPQPPVAEPPIVEPQPAQP